MEWQIKYEARSSMTPWTIYKVFDRDAIMEERFATEIEALMWVRKKEREEIYWEATNPNSLPPIPLQVFSFSNFLPMMKDVATHHETVGKK